MLVTRSVSSKVAKFLPDPLRSVLRTVIRRHRHWAHPALKNYGTVQDLYYWTVDGEVDTLLLLQNYFSALFPGIDTATTGQINLYTQDGSFIISKEFQLAANGCAKFTVSSILNSVTDLHSGTFGTLEVHIEIPRQVLDAISADPNFYFWDRFYLGYTTAQGQACFVHGVDKTTIYRNGDSESLAWYKSSANLNWAPEIPINIAEYARFSVILINRTGEKCSVGMVVTDKEDRSLSWSADIPSKGVHRFVLDQSSVTNLNPAELRIGIEGMASQYGRPVVFKEFHNGSISAMHC